MDFTVHKYCQLLDALLQSQMSFHLRHDVDLLPQHSLRTARLEAQRDISATYYFRVVPESYDEQVIKEIKALGHEIGYHYESLTTCNGNIDQAYLDFCNNLERLRTLAPIQSICMHGSPRSPWDSKDIWKKYDYHTLGVAFEPYLDTDFSQSVYLTDTGRRWDGYRVSVRDKIPGFQEEWESLGLKFHSTDEIIEQLLDSDSPLRKSGKKVLLTTHPQRWNPFGFAYVKEFSMQMIKNVYKRMLVKKKIQDNKQ